MLCLPAFPSRHFCPRTLKALLPLLGMIFLLTGCQTTSMTPIRTSSTGKLQENQAVYIATPANGTYGSKVYQGSGNAVVVAFERAFSPHTTFTMQGPVAMSLSDILADAKLKRCAYAVQPKITHWEDRNTEWSGIRDKMSLFVRVFRVADSREIFSAEIQGKSSYFTFGGDHPEDLLAEPVDEFVQSLY